MSLICGWLEAQTDGFYEAGYFPEVLAILTGAGYDIPFITLLMAIFVCDISSEE